MRNINKTCNLSTVYRTWEEGLENTGTNHPKYTNSTTRNNHYQDIKMQLYHCQNGLCAYTEMRLCSKEFYESTNWENGKYKTDIEKGIGRGQLDHFDESLKSKNNDVNGIKDWLWDNFFMVDSDVNTVVKRSLPVHPSMKPDSPNYDPFNLMEYDIDTHTFIPNTTLDEATQKIIEDSIYALGINTVYSQRRNYIMKEMQLISLEEKSFDEIKIDEFPTAFEMHKRKANNQDHILGLN